jgi:hypothetical protein
MATQKERGLGPCITSDQEEAGGCQPRNAKLSHKDARRRQALQQQGAGQGGAGG